MRSNSVETTGALSNRVSIMPLPARVSFQTTRIMALVTLASLYVYPVSIRAVDHSLHGHDVR